jgi:hypothetical protein
MLRRSDLLRSAAVALHEKRYADARTILRPLLERDPNDPEALLMMANIRAGISAVKVPPAPQKPPQPPPENRPPAPVCPAPVSLSGSVVKEYNGASNRTLSWTGTFNPTCTLSIRGGIATVGRLEPRGRDLATMPGVRASVSVVSPPGVEVVAQPAEQNNFTLTLRNLSDKPVTGIQLRWHDESLN